MFDTVELILNEYADAAFEDIDVVVGLQFQRVSRTSFELPHQPTHERDSFVISWRSIFVVFVAFASFFTILAALFLRKSGNRLREVVKTENIEEKDVPCLFPIVPILAVKEGDKVYTGEAIYEQSAMCSLSRFNEDEECTEQSRQVFLEPNFPLQLSKEDRSEDDDNQEESAHYDFDDIHLASSMNREEEIRVQRRQLLREYKFPDLEQSEEQGRNYRGNENNLDKILITQINPYHPN